MKRQSLRLMATSKRASPVPGPNASTAIKRSCTLALSPPLLRYMYANNTELQSHLYGLLNDTDLALLSLTCKLVLRSVVDYYEVQARGEDTESSALWNRERRIRLSECFGSLELQRFYATTIQCNRPLGI
ncbi:hypothetical protein CYMTET_3920 [Cymbomonas tetramitiformis]|uniref:Uncharacterized protein n=1 Tax=Cymbomonas tetramitiformis TaxID=36881 RepID=A0AAE0H2A2_9CHLO|nr:hypothetical protein CYMTET_3920 [Cymbomonas tetramitiformis]